ncbi:hypothetical protein [Cohnella fermenti]|uniref:Uncharacterized protein n=1 Tax=Cohnella fermenti TaxID=2565925 RepID=A0A4S4C308_9BACL|nr:hypothetical protein [Cohnella fermenti]THF82107.1 hypothetical protein E6C55_06895 [Cohnella fermenti]
MTLTISENKKKAIVTYINDHFDEHMSHFPYAKYPTEPLDRWREQFLDPKALGAEMLHSALSWHFGSWQRNSLTYSQRKTVSSITQAWPQFLGIADNNAESEATFWLDKLPDRQHGFDATAFLLHLRHPGELEIADRHRLDAMLELLRSAGCIAEDAAPEPSFSLLQDYSAFFRAILPKMPYGDESRIRLDRFLKMYGNRHAYVNLSADYKTKEPMIRSFQWDTARSERFNLEQITKRANADVLFACFLLTLEKENLHDIDLTIGEIADRLPPGTGGICNSASFNYAMVALFGGQKSRDYWIVENPALRNAFTDQANSSSRDMRFYLHHAGEKIRINPKYIRSEE